MKPDLTLGAYLISLLAGLLGGAGWMLLYRRIRHPLLQILFFLAAAPVYWFAIFTPIRRYAGDRPTFLCVILGAGFGWALGEGLAQRSRSREREIASRRPMVLQWPHCEVCQLSLKPKAVVRGARARGSRTYPFVMLNGKREERPVYWICGPCLQRAEQHRAGEAVISVIGSQ